jgi:hypothetical protein
MSQDTGNTDIKLYLSRKLVVGLGSTTNDHWLSYLVCQSTKAQLNIGCICKVPQLATQVNL